MTENLTLKWLGTVFECGRDTLKVVMIINGGASIALLAFLGNAIGKESSEYLIYFSVFSLLFFSLGVFISGSAAFLTYLAYWGVASRSTYKEKEQNDVQNKNPGWFAKNFGMLFLIGGSLIFLSLVFFFVGVVLSIIGIANY